MKKIYIPNEVFDYIHAGKNGNLLSLAWYYDSICVPKNKNKAGKPLP